MRGKVSHNTQQTTLMNKLVASLLAFIACLSLAHASQSEERDVTKFVQSVLSDRASLVSSVLSEINDQTTFSGSFESYASELQSLVSSILSEEDASLTSVEIELSTTTVKTSNAGATATGSNGLFGMISVLLAGLVFFYAF